MTERWRPSGDHLHLDAGDDVVLLRLDRSEVLNALTLEMLADLAAGLRWYGTGGRARAIVIAGAGRAFSSGDDLKVTEGLDANGFAELIDHFQDVTRAILDTEVAVVAALNGIAVGGAAEIALACDLRVGGPGSDLLLPENGLGLTISNGSSLTLPRLLGPGALGAVLLGRWIPAERALDLGLIDVWVSDPSTVEPEARRVASEVGEDGRATSLHLSMLRPPREEMEQALERERRAAIRAWERGWPQEGIRRFKQGRSRASSGERHE